MFTIKVTYLGQTRKHTFPDTNTFPSYDDICLQLHRVFDISKDFYLSRLLFSPDAASAAQILIGKEVHSAADYDKYTRQFKDRYWPNPLLRFSICESSTSGFPPSAPPVLNIRRSSDSFGVTASYPSFTATATATATATGPPQSSSSRRLFQHYPHHPVSSSSNSASPFHRSLRRQGTFPNLTPPRVDPSLSSSRPTPQHRVSSISAASCCAVSQGREEVKKMLVNFQTNLNKVLEDNLGAPSMSSSSSPPSTVTSPPPALCSVCTLNISESNSGRDTWFSCVNCHVVVCEHCYDEQRPGFCMSTKTDHVMKQADAPFIGVTPLAPVVPIAHLPSPWMPTATVAASAQPVAQSPGPSNTASATPAAPVIHAGVVCDSCSAIIEGVRHKCLDCPDYDLCTPCITNGASIVHNPFHEFFEITEPGRVIVHTVFSGNGERETAASRNNRASTSETRAAPQPAAAQPQQRPAAHLATCDLCDSRIIGDRYKCAACPDFDACASCFNITREQHPGHAFVRITKPADYIRVNGVAPQKHYANCDGCQKTIYGIRFKCMHPQCPDYDLCDKCEALPIPVHPSSHPMLKLASPDTIIPSVYRVGQPVPSFANDTPFIRSNSYGASTTVKEETVFEAPALPDEEPISTPKAEPSLPPWLRAESPLPEKVPVKSALSEDERPPLPPKPEMISHPSWASIPSLFPTPVNVHSLDDNIYYRSSNSGTYADLVNPFADMPAPPAEAPVAADEYAHHGGEQQMMEKNISLPSVPSHIPNPWPTTNRTERQELLQLIADFAGPSTSAKVIRSLTDAPRRRRSFEEEEEEPQAPLLDLSVENVQRLSQEDVGQLKPQHVLPDVPVEPKWVNMFDVVEKTPAPAVEVPAPPAQPTVAEDRPSLLTGFNDFQLSHLLERVEKLKIPETNAAPSESSFGEHELLKTPAVAKGRAADREIVSGSMADLIQSAQSFAETEPEAQVEVVEPVPERAAPVTALSSAFVEDVTVPDGQIFPPGAEFVKCWRLLNDSGRDWPESTSLVFVAGESLMAEKNSSASIHIGTVAAGTEIDVWTSELKAPEVPGRYVGYWRLRADDELFGNSLWIEINVAESDSHSSSEDSMAASSIIMPVPSSVQQTVASVTAGAASVSAATTEGFTEDNLSDAGSDISLISMPSSPSSDEDEALWHDTRSYTTEELAAAAAANAARANSARAASSNGQAAHTPASAMDYVLLYDDNSSSDSEA